MSSKRGKATGQGYNFGKGEKAEMMRKKLARMRKDPAYVKRIFGVSIGKAKDDA